MVPSPMRKRTEVSPVAGVKRPAPSLLPAFEPFLSSPTLPRPPKRQARVHLSKNTSEKCKYPTPVPTSSTGILSSSPPQLPYTRHPGIHRTLSTFSERAPLSTVPSVELEGNGEPTLMGRSSNSSHYQLSTNKFISRVHVRARYVSAIPPTPGKVEVECVGWNGVKVHCQGRAWELGKGDSFATETEDADIMIDVQDARLLVQWPRIENRASTSTDSESTYDEGNPLRHTVSVPRRMSPLRSTFHQHDRLQSPVSPSPAVQAVFATSSTFLASDPPIPFPVQVYEDQQSSDEENPAVIPSEATQSTQQASQPFTSGLQESQSSILSDPQDYSDQDEENDPVIHSFGPFGDNLLPRMVSFTTGESPVNHRHPDPLREATVSPQRRASSESTRDDETSPVVNHVINQLAYSRLSSTPLSIIMSHLPADLKTDSPGSKENRRLSLNALRKMLDATQCIGEVPREGKDAAGKTLESEYYYIPDKDSDEKRRDAVVDGLRKPGLRACRKQHKVGNAKSSK
ncbi:hypothetical protein MMC12_004657 [Toensbergia leucococca]|nr:hypothetical protein [Toensbergia leucococca]